MLREARNYLRQVNLDLDETTCPSPLLNRGIDYLR